MLRLPPSSRHLIGSLLGRGSSTLVLRGTGVVAGFSMHVLIARLLGAQHSGIIFLAWSLLFISVVLGKRAMDTALLRHAGPAWEQGDSHRLRSLLHAALQQSLRFSLLAALCLAVLAAPLSQLVFGHAELLTVLLLFALTVIPYSRVWVYAGFLKVVDRPQQAIAAEGLVTPALMLPAILLLDWLQILSVISVAAAYLVCNLATLALCAWHVRQLLPESGKALSPQPELLASASPLMGVEALNWLIIWSAVPILGLFAPADEVARYNVAFRLTVQISLVLVICNAVVAPRFAGLYQHGRIDALRTLARTATLLMTLAALPLAALLMFRPELVTLLFGDEFAAAAELIPVLAFAQLVNVATGPAGYLLVTTGHERLMRNIMIGNALLTLPLVVVLSWQWQAQGAALATASGLIAQNLLALGFVRRRVLRPAAPGNLSTSAVTR